MIKRTAFGWATLFAACIAAAVACSSSSSKAPPASDAGSDTTSPGTCVSGQSIACAGPGGCSGYQVCSGSGAYDPCVCGSGSDAAADVVAPTGDASVDAGDAGSEGAADVFIPNDGPAVLQGAIQKGPFVSGSTVTISTIDGAGVPTGQVFDTQTTDNVGDFTVTFGYRGNVDMASTGFYYDEVTGGLSTASITLRALYVVGNGGPQSAHINIVTHLAHDRAIVLMGDAGMSLAAAEAQAEGELVAALGVGGTGFNPGGTGTGLDEVGSNDDQNAYLFAVSAVLMQLASTQPGTGSVDAKLQQVIDDIAGDLASDGLIASTWTPLLRKAEQSLDVDFTTDQFAAYLASIGSTAVPVDLNRAIDSDGDGYRNSVDTCPNVANTNQAVIPAGVVCKDFRHTTNTSTTRGSMLLGDFEHKGQIGLLFGETGTLSYYLGDGAGRFPKHSGIVLPSGFEVFATYDLNQDGNLDLLGPTSWLPGDGKGGFTPVTPYDTTADGGGPTFFSVYPGDVNGDGLIDVVRYCNEPSGSSEACIGMSLATAKGVFAPAVVTAHPEISASLGGPGPMGQTAIAPANLNGDAYMDLVGFARAPGPDFGVTVIGYLGGASGTFTEETPSPVPAVSLIYSAGFLGDFDGDGHVDAAMWGCPGNCSTLTTLVVAYGNGDGTFGAMSTTPLKGTAYDTLGVGDFNNDGKSDLAYCYGSALGVLVSEGRSFGALQYLRGPIPSLSGFAVGDLNGDGIPDVTVSTWSNTTGTASLQGFIMTPAGAL